MRGSGLDCAEAVSVNRNAGPRRLRDMLNRILQSVCCVVDFMGSLSTLKINFSELVFTGKEINGCPRDGDAKTTSAL